MIDLSGLNPQQRHAAETINGPVLILAGAGSGKTRTVTYRIAHMIANLRIPPKDILAVSFTNKASMEMHERVSKLLGPRRKRGITLSTFHSLGIRILREEIHLIGYNKNFTIYDTSDQLSIVREGLKRLKADKTNFDKKSILSKIGQLKNNSITAQQFANSDFFDPENPYDVATESVYHFYEDKLQFCNAVDFDDILFLCAKLFKEQPSVAQKYSEKYRYIMIDEYQDTNGLQLEMVRALTSCHQNICVVGDDDQSIYAFRGADITNILNFEKFYPGAKIIKLEQNYRSSSKILSLANKIIKENKKRKDKTMFSEVEHGPQPVIWACGNSDHEAQTVVDEIIKYQMEGKFLGEVAILYRSNTQVPPFEDQLRLAQVPYTIIGGQKFYEKKEIKDLIAYLSVVNNPKDELSLRRILNIPHRGIGTKTLQQYLHEAKEKNTSLFEVIKLHCHDDSKRSLALKEFIEIINYLRKIFQTQRLDQALSELINKINYMDFIERGYDSPKIVARKKDDVKNFIFSADKFQDRFKEEATLSFWLERLLLADAHDRQNPEDEILKNEVQLMTFHSSKGLEFDTVFMVGQEEELLPHKNCIKEDREIDEERRLCYVGVTRAKRKLVLTYAKERKIYGKDIPRNKSRFLTKLDNHDLLEQDRTNFGHLSSEDEVEAYKSSYFNDLLSSLND